MVRARSKRNHIPKFGDAHDTTRRGPAARRFWPQSRGGNRHSHLLRVFRRLSSHLQIHYPLSRRSPITHLHFGPFRPSPFIILEIYPRDRRRPVPRRHQWRLTLCGVHCFRADPSRVCLLLASRGLELPVRNVVYALLPFASLLRCRLCCRAETLTWCPTWDVTFELPNAEDHHQNLTKTKQGRLVDRGCVAGHMPARHVPG